MITNTSRRHAKNFIFSGCCLFLKANEVVIQICWTHNSKAKFNYLPFVGGAVYFILRSASAHIFARSVISVHVCKSFSSCLSLASSGVAFRPIFPNIPQQRTNIPQQPTNIPQHPTNIPKQPTNISQQPTNIPQSSSSAPSSRANLVGKNNKVYQQWVGPSSSQDLTTDGQGTHSLDAPRENRPLPLRQAGNRQDDGFPGSNASNSNKVSRNFGSGPSGDDPKRDRISIWGVQGPPPTWTAIYIVRRKSVPWPGSIPRERMSLLHPTKSLLRSTQKRSHQCAAKPS